MIVKTMITFNLENVQTIPYRIVLTYSFLFFVSETRMLTRTIFDMHLTRRAMGYDAKSIPNEQNYWIRIREERCGSDLSLKRVTLRQTSI